MWFAASNCIFRVLHSVTSQHLLLHRLYYVLPYAQTKEAFKKFLGEKNITYAILLNNLALLYASVSANEKAEPLYSQANNLFKELLGVQDPNYVNGITNLATLYQSMGLFSKAEPLLVQLVDIRRKTPRDVSYATSLNSLSLLYISMER